MAFRTLLLTLGCAAVALASPTKIANDVTAAAASGGTVPVIVEFQSQPGVTDTGALSGLAGAPGQMLKSVHGVAIRLPAAVLNRVALLPEVTYIALDRAVSRSMDYTLPATHADLAQRYGFDGSSVTVAVIDSGIAPLQDFGSGRNTRVIYRESFLNPTGALSTNDRYGHGTHVAGIIGGDGASWTALHGIAPKVRLVDLQALDANGVGTDSSVIRALERAVELKDVLGIRVVNLSLGRPIVESYRDDPLCQAVEAAWKAGLAVIVAAGNQGRAGLSGSGGYWTITSPGNDPYVLTVGAMKTMATAGRGDDLVASYSSKGPTLIDNVVKPDLVAPGNRVTSLLSGQASTLFAENPSAGVAMGPGSARFLQLSGTSMAAAAVSGAAALLLEKEPWLTPDQVKVRLMRTATKTFPHSSVVVDVGQVYTSQYDVFTVGAGYLDILAALSDGRPASGAAISPVAARDALTGVVTVTAPAGSEWAYEGLPAVWGNLVFTPAGTSAAWGASAAWGSSAVWGASAAWGSSAAWGASAAWGSSAAWGASFPARGEP